MRFMRFFIISILCLLLGTASLVMAAAQGNDPHNPEQNQGVPSLQRMALKAILKMQDQGYRVPPDALPHSLMDAIAYERQLQEKAFRVVTYKPAVGAIGELIRPIKIDGTIYRFVYIHPNSSFFGDIQVGQRYVTKKSRANKASILRGFLNAVDYPGPTAEDTLFVLSGDLLPQ